MNDTSDSFISSSRSQLEKNFVESHTSNKKDTMSCRRVVICLFFLLVWISSLSFTSWKTLGYNDVKDINKQICENEWTTKFQNMCLLTKHIDHIFPTLAETLNSPTKSYWTISLLSNPKIESFIEGVDPNYTESTIVCYYKHGTLSLKTDCVPHFTGNQEIYQKIFLTLTLLLLLPCMCALGVG